jgi:ribosome-binding factor A
MRFKRALHKDILSSCAEIGPDDGVDPRTYFRKHSRKVANRKALQMCAQIARTLSLVLSESRDEMLRNLLVEAVEPAPDSTRVLASVRLPADMADVDCGDVLQRLQAVCGRLRSEAAAAIHRKRVPELIFRVLGCWDADK